VWYLNTDLGIYGKIIVNRTVEADTIREASQKVRRWCARRDFLIAKKGNYILEPGGGPLVLLEKQAVRYAGKRYFKNITIKMKDGL